MSTGVIIATTAAISAAADAEQAKEIAACSITMPTFQHAGASVDQMHAYAHCVSLLYPMALSAGDGAVLKLGFIVCLISAAVGAVAGGYEYRGWFDAIMGGLFGFCVGVLLAAVGATGYMIFS